MKNLLIILFCLLSFLIVFNPVLKQEEYRVLGVLGDEYLYIDLNKNLKIDENELVKIKGVEFFPVKYSDEIEDIKRNLNLKEDEIRTLAYYANKYLIENFKGKYVRLEDFDGIQAKILLNNTDCALFLIKNGLAYLKDNFNSDYIFLRLKGTKSVEYYIYDIKNEIIHKNNCPETKNIGEFEIVKRSDLEDEVKLCKKCFGKEQNKKSNNRVLYPPFYKKGNFTLYLMNPYIYSKPSNTQRVEVCKFLVNEINKAHTLYFSIYGVDNQDGIINAINNLRKRGGVVFGVSDSNEKGIPSYLDMEKFKNVEITYDNKISLMHNKFFVIDDKTVLTGSMNISKTGCGGYNANSAAVINNKTLALAYKNEFMQMKNGIFKKQKKDFSVSNVKVNSDTTVSAYFSPSGNLYEVFDKEIKKAKRNIRVSIFVLTYDKIAEDLISASKRGVKVRVMADATGAASHKRLIYKLRENNIDVKIENWGGKNHEKTMSIDDNVLIMGSANFTYAAIDRNDENLIVVYDKDITTFYNGFFDSLYNRIPNIYLKRFPLAEGFESKNSCTDGIDNDFDGKIDFEDEGCKNKR